MVCKEDVCLWFSRLNPHTRIDVMCGLLHMCIPLELRFLGSVLEDLGKKDYHSLREAEIKANLPSDLTKAGDGSSDSIRNKLTLSIALLHSPNRQCSNILYNMLEANVDQALSVLPSMDVVTVYEILTILVMASHHPAFTFDQNRKMSIYLERAERIALAENLITKDEFISFHHGLLENQTDGGKCSARSCHSCVKEKAHVCSIEVKGTRKSSDKHYEFLMHVTWSNGDVTEVYKTYQQLHEFHSKLVNMFQEEVHKLEQKMPFFQGYKEDNLDHLLLQISSYTRQLVKLSQKLLECDHMVQFFGGPSQPLTSRSSVDSTPAIEPVISPYHRKSFTVYNSQLFPNNVPHTGDINSRQLHSSNLYSTVYSQSSSSQRPACMNNQVAPQALSPMFSTNSSPHTSPPVSRSTSPGSSETAFVTQVFKQLNLLQKHEETLSKCSFEQLYNFTGDDYEKRGLPRDLYPRLKIKMEQLQLAREKVCKVPNGLMDYTIVPGNVSGPPANVTWNTSPLHAPFFPTAQRSAGPYQNPVPGLYICYPPPQVTVTGGTDSSTAGSDYCSQPSSPGPLAKIQGSTEECDRVKSTKEGELSHEQEMKKKDRHKVNMNLTSGVKGMVVPSVSGRQSDESKGNIHMHRPNPYLELRQEVSQIVGTVPTQYPSDQSGIIPSFAQRQQLVPFRSTYNGKAQPAHTNVGVHAKNIINMPMDGHSVKNSGSVVPLVFAPGIHNEAPAITTTVVTVTFSNIVGSSAMSDGSHKAAMTHLSSPGVRTRTPPINQAGICSPRTACSTSNVVFTTASSIAVPAPLQSTVVGSIKNGNSSKGPQQEYGVNSLNSGVELPGQAFAGQCRTQTAVTTTISHSSPTFTLGSQVPGGPPRNSCSTCGCNGYCSSGPYHPLVGMIPSQLATQQWHLPSGYFAPGSNGLTSPFPYGQIHHPQFLNGLSPELFYSSSPNLGLMHVGGQTGPCMLNAFCGYGVNHHGLHHNTPVSKPKNISCYNCGGLNHRATDCKENTMDSMSGNYHLNYKPSQKSDSE